MTETVVTAPLAERVSMPAPVSKSPAKSSRHLALAIGAAVALALACLGGYLLWRPAAFKAIHPVVGTAITAVYASGTVEASVMLPVAPRIGGRLVALAADEHDNVRKGQPLARLEDADVANNIVQLQAMAEFARTDAERDARLWAQNAIARQVYDRAIAAWRQADAAVRQAQAQAAYMTLRAPDDCEVIQRDGEVGQYLAANASLFWLSCHARLRISALVDEEDISLVKPGQQVLIRADAFPGKTFTAKVSEITPKGDPVGRSYRVRILLPSDTPLRIGMTSECNIIISRDDHALLLPSSAVANGKVWRIEEGRARQVAISAGAKSNDRVQVLQGLATADVVLLDGTATPGANPRIEIAGP